MVAKPNINNIRSRAEECVAASEKVADWLKTRNGDGDELTDALWRIIGLNRDGSAAANGLIWMLDNLDNCGYGYEGGVNLIYRRCVKSGHDELPAWVRDGMRASYTEMLSVAFDVDEVEINTDVDSLRIAGEAVDKCSKIGGAARKALARR